MAELEFELWETYSASGRPSRFVMDGSREEIEEYVDSRKEVLPYAVGNYIITGGDTGLVVASDEEGFTRVYTEEELEELEEAKHEAYLEQTFGPGEDR